MSTGLNRLHSGHAWAGKWPGRAPASVTSTSARGSAFLTGAHCQQSMKHTRVFSHLAVGLLLKSEKGPVVLYPSREPLPEEPVFGDIGTDAVRGTNSFHPRII